MFELEEEEQGSSEAEQELWAKIENNPLAKIGLILGSVPSLQSSQAQSPLRFRTSTEAISLIQKSGSFPSIFDFSVVYFDRFKGLSEKQLGNLQLDVTHDDFVPTHRIWGLKFRGLVVWDRERRLDLLPFNARSNYKQ